MAESAQKQLEREIPGSVKAYANVVHWITIISAIASLFVPIFILANPANNVLNPNVIFGAIFEGAAPAQIWAMSSEGAFPGAHFYLEHFGSADGWAMLFMNLGCAVGFFGLIPAIILQIKEKDWFCAILGTMLAALILLSMTGILSLG
ncbi:hypothetical protein LJC14_01375 [Treponema sp. OttesenSCG-928-L16]|nr:hypothetical protein [Treponema sp. OttesenSCG-928-L16]